MPEIKNRSILKNLHTTSFLKKNSLLIFFLSVAVLGIFSSCNKYDDDEELNYDPELIGTWRTEYSLEEVTQVMVLSLNKDLSGFTQTYPKKNPNTDKTIISYTIDGNIINLVYPS